MVGSKLLELCVLPLSHSLCCWAVYRILHLEVAAALLFSREQQFRD
jgi:hypothetical protein